MNKEEFNKQVAAELQSLKEHAMDLNKFIESLTLAARNDVSFSAMKEAQKILAETKESKASIERLQKVLKQRAIAAMKEV